MKVLIRVFIKVPRKLYHIIYNKCEYIYYRYFYSKPKIDIEFTHNRFLLSNKDNLDEIAQNYKNIFPDKIIEKIHQADKICKHIFCLLGSGITKLSAETDKYNKVEINISLIYPQNIFVVFFKLMFLFWI